MNETNNRKRCVGGGVASLESWKVLKKENLLKYLEGKWREKDCEFNVILLHSRFGDSLSYMR